MILRGEDFDGGGWCIEFIRDTRFSTLFQIRANHVDVHLNERRRQTEGGRGIKMEVEGEYHLLHTSQSLIEWLYLG